MDGKIYDELGCLLLFSKASKEDIDLLMDLITNERYSYLAILRDLVKDDAALIKLFDVMAGMRVPFPKRRKMYKTLERITMYNFCKSRNFSEDSYRIVSKQFNKRVPQVKAIVATMQKFIDNMDYDIDKVKVED